jgi:hypothetical protein
MSRKSKVNIKVGRIVITILVVIGTITVVDNTIRLIREVTHTISHHQWSMVIIK